MKTAFITGGGRGLGKGFATYFLQKGYQVFIGVRDPSKISDDLKKNTNLVAVGLDVTSDESIHTAFLEVQKHCDHIDFLVNNAGLTKKTATNGKGELVCSLKLLSRSHLMKMFEVNTVSPILIVREFLPLLNRNPSYVINISSASSSRFNEYPNSSGNYGYRASKAALNMITHASLHDLPNNIRTFAVHPGGIKTDANPLGTMDIAIQIEKVMEIPKNWNPKFNGQFLRFDGTLYPI